MEDNKKSTDKEVINESVLGEENVARILSREWVVRGRLQFAAFALQPGETYISVNRPIIETYTEDVRNFLLKHLEYLIEEGSYRRALLNVQDIRNIVVEVDGAKIAAEVEVEPRAVHTKSHAGIFTRYDGKTLKTGKTILLKEQEKGVSSDDILMDVRWSLLSIASVEDCLIAQ